MIKTTKKFLVLLTIVVTFFSCTKDTPAALPPAVPPPAVQPTSLTLTVLDENNSVVSGAYVSLFTSLNDWENLTNQIGTQQLSNSSGKATFSGLLPQKYYWYIDKVCRNNQNTGITTASNLTANIENTVNAPISPTADMKFINNSTNPYRIYLDGNIINNSLAGGFTFIKHRVPTGVHTVRVLQLSGYLFFPTDNTYTTQSLLCGGAYQLTIP